MVLQASYGWRSHFFAPRPRGPLACRPELDSGPPKEYGVLRRRRSKPGVTIKPKPTFRLDNVVSVLSLLNKLPFQGSSSIIQPLSVIRKAKTILFIDSSVFLGSALGELDGSTIQVLKDIRKHLNDNKVVLIVPELVIVEVRRRLKIRLETLKQSFNESITKKKDDKDKQRSRLITSALEKSRKDFFTDIETAEKDISKVLDSIFQHRNTSQPKLSPDIILRGLQRALLMRPPFTIKDGSYVLHQDCINFELLLEALSEFSGAPQKELIVCSDDADYFSDTKKANLNRELEKELLQKVKKVTAYSNPAKMLQDKFKEGYSKKEVELYPESLKVALGDAHVKSGYASFQDSLNSAIISSPSSRPFSVNLADGMAHIADGSMGYILPTHVCPSCHKAFSETSLASTIGGTLYGDWMAGMKQLRCPYCGWVFND